VRQTRGESQTRGETRFETRSERGSYQAGATEHTEVQTAGLRQLYDGLRRDNQPTMPHVL